MTDDSDLMLPLVWDVDDRPVIWASVFGIVGHPDNEFILSVGQVEIPQLTGTDEDKLKRLSTVDKVAIHVVGRYSLTRPKVEALVGLLQDALSTSRPTAAARKRKR
jgi:hypothetical protein